MQKYTSTYTIGRFQCDRYGVLRIRALFNLLQDMADNHADSINIGYHFCIEKNLTWMGSFYHLKINRMPQQEEKVTINTWPIKTASPLTARREFEVFDEKGVLIMTGSSQWILVDIIKKRPISILPYMEGLDLREDIAQEADFSKLPAIESPSNQQKAIIREDDIDINQHVNNAVYPSLIMDMHSQEYLKTHFISDIKVQFKQGIVDKKPVLINAFQEEENLFIYTITDEESQSDFARISVVFKDKNQS